MTGISPKSGFNGAGLDPNGFVTSMQDAGARAASAITGFGTQPKFDQTIEYGENSLG